MTILRVSACVMSVAGLVSQLVSCAVPECANARFDDPECRVLAENELARTRTAEGIEVRFQDPSVATADSWDARGLVEELPDGVVRARVAGLGRFAISLTRPPNGPASLRVILDNVDPRAVVAVGPRGEEVPVDFGEPSVLRRTVDVVFSEDTTVWIRGWLDCPERFRVAVLGDIQTNPLQFARILERLADEREESEAAGAPLVGLVIVGDLTEASRDDEFETIQELVQNSPVPVAVTAGNHDIYRPLRPHYNQRFGPGNHPFSVCDARFVLLDSGNGHIAPSVEARLPILFSREDERYLVVGMHHPPHARLTGSGWSQEGQADHLLVEAVLADADLVIAGHNHALRDFAGIDVAGEELRQIISGTGGAYQGLGRPRYGYTRLDFEDGEIQPCFVEVPPPGYAGPANEELSDRLPYCE